MHLTIPQLTMLNHASKYNYESGEARRKWKAAQEKKRDEVDPVTRSGKRLSEMNTAETARHYGHFGATVGEV
jgi:hypothetical protein